jgi:hypothetical protein
MVPIGSLSVADMKYMNPIGYCNNSWSENLVVCKNYLFHFENQGVSKSNLSISKRANNCFLIYSKNIKSSMNNYRFKILLDIRA